MKHSAAAHGLLADANALIVRAQAAGQVITISLQSKQPLASGNYDMVPDVYTARVNGAYPEPVEPTGQEYQVYMLESNAKQHEERAARLRSLAATLKDISGPITYSIVEIASELSAHGVCVIEKSALEAAERCLTSFDASGDHSDIEDGLQIDDVLTAMRKSIAVHRGHSQ